MTTEAEIKITCDVCRESCVSVISHDEGLNYDFEVEAELREQKWIFLSIDLHQRDGDQVLLSGGDSLEVCNMCAQSVRKLLNLDENYERKSVPCIFPLAPAHE